MRSHPLDVFLADQQFEEFVVLGEILVLLGDVQTEERVLKNLVALADHDLEASPAELIDGSEIFGDSDRVE